MKKTEIEKITEARKFYKRSLFLLCKNITYEFSERNLSHKDMLDCLDLLCSELEYFYLEAQKIKEEH